MSIRTDRIERAQALMRKHGMVGIMVMNHDDYRYFFGRDWAQPRAIIPLQGPPVMIAFAAEAPEMREYVGDAQVEIFTHVGEQINDVTSAFRDILMAAGGPPGGGPGEGEKGGPGGGGGAVPGAGTGGRPGMGPAGGKPKVGMQLWFETPAFLVDLFRRVNPMIELVSSDPVIDALRGVKEPEELELMTEAQRIAGIGMDRAQELLRPGVAAHEIATEALYAVMKAGAGGTSTPVYVNFGSDTCMLHGRVSEKPLERGQMAVITLNPQVDGYCANLSRTFVLGAPTERQRGLLEAYPELIEATRAAMKPGARVRDLDAEGKKILQARGLDELHIEGISHGIGLRFEETPASTIQKQHRNVEIHEGMTLTIGHTVLAMPGVGGVRSEDVYRVTPDGGEILYEYPREPIVAPS